MKKITSLLMLGALALTAIPLAACDSSSTSEPSSEPSQVTPSGDTPIVNDSGLPTDIVPLGEPGIQIHYQRVNGTYTEWCLWLWGEGKDGEEYPFNYQDEYGVIAYYPLSHFGNPKSLGFIVKKLFKFTGGGWEKDGNYDRFMDLDFLTQDENEVYHVYIKSKSKNVYTDPERNNLMDAVKLCQFENTKEILVETNNPIKDPVLKRNGEVVDDITISGGKTKKNIRLKGKAEVVDAYDLDIEFEDGLTCTRNVSIRKLYTRDFDKKYFYDGELGAIYSKEQTTFRVWSPISSDIKLRIYNNGTPLKVDTTKGDDTHDEYVMERNKTTGIFEYTLKGDLQGKYYTYVVTNGYNQHGKEIVDPYAKGCGVNGLRGMIVDFSRTNPTGWNNLNYSKVDRKHLTVYETTVPDLTSSETWNGKAENAKKFLGMVEGGTTYTKEGTTVKTGFDHIKELGVNAIQVVPFFDGSNDEVNPTFNWGYNPLNYNCIEGAYSSNPFDGYTRINELKQVIMAYKQAGIAFIMDVVYNHVSGLAGSNFDVLMPFYYFRYTETGGASSGSGCGNDTASERLMYRKFMIDSTEFWTKEFKLDGFRFDLMGLHDITTMNELVANLKTINSNITVYGEPWMMGTALSYDTPLASQDNASSYKGFGQFNDQGRDSLLAGGLKDKKAKGWMNSTKNPVMTLQLKDMINGITTNATKDPNKTVNYVTCHDNYTIHDRNIVAGIYDEEFIKKSSILANSFVMTSQGTSFMLSGEELLRTKTVFNEDGTPKVDETVEDQVVYEVSGNSYNSCYKTNEIDWALKIKHLDLFKQYQKVIWLKQNISDLGLDESATLFSDTFKVISERNDCVIKTTFADGNDRYVAYFGSPALYNYSKDTKDPYIINIEDQEVYLATQHNSFAGKTIELQPQEVVILKGSK